MSSPPIPTWSPGGLRIDWTGSLRRIPVPLDLDASLAVFERHLQNFDWSGLRRCPVRPAPRRRALFGGQDPYQPAHSGRSARHGAAHWNTGPSNPAFHEVRGSRHCFWSPAPSPWPAVAASVPSPSSPTCRSIPRETFRDVSWWPRSRAIRASSELRHSSMRSLVTAALTAACDETR
jgi:hypothetical protein